MVRPNKQACAIIYPNKPPQILTMAKKIIINPEDLAVFKNAVKDAKQLIHKKVRLSSAKFKRHIITPKIDDLFPTFTPHELPTVQANESISYIHSSISTKILRNLRQGQYTIEAKLDLHGMTVKRAKLAVDDFLQTCFRHNMRVALIIHGKGQQTNVPILKNMLNQWLRQIPMVLAFCSAQTVHGSRGAIYVLLKQQTGEGD